MKFGYLKYAGIIFCLQSSLHFNCKSPVNTNEFDTLKQEYGYDSIRNQKTKISYHLMSHTDITIVYYDSLNRVQEISHKLGDKFIGPSSIFFKTGKLCLYEEIGFNDKIYYSTCYDSFGKILSKSGVSLYSDDFDDSKDTFPTSEVVSFKFMYAEPKGSKNKFTITLNGEAIREESIYISKDLHLVRAFINRNKSEIVNIEVIGNLYENKILTLSDTLRKTIVFK